MACRDRVPHAVEIVTEVASSPFKLPGRDGSEIARGCARWRANLRKVNALLLAQNAYGCCIQAAFARFVEYLCSSALARRKAGRRQLLLHAIPRRQ